MMNEAEAADLAAKMNAIIAAAGEVSEELTLSNVYDVLRPDISRQPRKINTTQVKKTVPSGLPGRNILPVLDVPPGYLLTERDPYFKRMREVAERDGNVAQFWEGVNEVADRLAAVEAMFYDLDPLPPARAMKILSQKQPVRDWGTNELEEKGSCQPLTEVLPDHILDWDAARDAADAAAP